MITGKSRTTGETPASVDHGVPVAVVRGIWSTSKRDRDAAVAALQRDRRANVEAESESLHRTHSAHVGKVDTATGNDVESRANFGRARTRSREVVSKNRRHPSRSARSRRRLRTFAQRHDHGGSVGAVVDVYEQASLRDCVSRRACRLAVSMERCETVSAARLPRITCARRPVR